MNFNTFSLVLFLILSSIKSNSDLISTTVNLMPLIKVNQKITTVKIGNQVWMNKNLNTETFQNGDPIFEAKTSEEWGAAGKERIPAYCYYQFFSKNGIRHGKLYNYYAVRDARGLAPFGWHIPSKSEFDSLIDYLGGTNIAGNKMKAKSGWTLKGNGTNESGFNALPSGCIGASDFFYNIGNNCFWWTSSIEGNYLYNNSWYVMLSNNNSEAYINSTQATEGFSIRCIKNK